ncbi:helix-turn-helix transcriptional regulator [Streptomyces venezuelae]|uniref:helix-turn-helix transcriptional regulator n=1 Tax=Streptomyces venezuelae TaxID=54571 RepID=UPI0034398C7D
MTTASRTDVTGVPKREVAVVQVIAFGLTARRAARILGLKPSTVESYARKAGQRVGASGRAATVSEFYVRKWIPLPEPMPVAASLTDGQRELLPFVVWSKTYKQMASRLGRPLASVRSDTVQLMQALGTKSRPHVVTLSLQYGLATTEQLRTWVSLVSEVQGTAVAGGLPPARE